MSGQQVRNCESEFEYNSEKKETVQEIGARERVQWRNWHTAPTLLSSQPRPFLIRFLSFILLYPHSSSFRTWPLWYLIHPQNFNIQTLSKVLTIFLALEPKTCRRVAAIWFEIKLLLLCGRTPPHVVSTLVNTLLKPTWTMPSCALSVESNSTLQTYRDCSSF